MSGNNRNNPITVPAITTAPSVLTANQQSLYQQLIDLGIDSIAATNALIVGKCAAVENALDYIYSHTPIIPAPPSVPAGTTSTAANNTSNSSSSTGSGSITGKRSGSTTNNTTTTGQPPTKQQNTGNNNNSSDTDLERALALSLQSTNISVSGVSADEQLMNEAILASLQSDNANAISNPTAVWVDPADPNKRKRLNNNIPVGLKNTTSTICYFNSLIQVYYLLRPTLFNAIMTANTTIPSTIVLAPSQLNSLEFLSELQLIYSYLTYSNRKYYDPIKAVNALFKYTGNEKETKLQHDAIEFNELILETIDTALKTAELIKQHNNTATAAPAAAITDTAASNVIHQLFYGTAESTIKITTVDSTDSAAGGIDSDDIDIDISTDNENKIESESQSQSNNTILLRNDSNTEMVPATTTVTAPIPTPNNVSTESYSQLIIDINTGNLISALSAYTHSTVDIRDTSSGNTGNAVSASKTLSLLTLPTILCFQLQRVSYDKSLGSAIKNNSKFTFDPIIYMDRYLFQYRIEAEKKLNQLKSLELKYNSIQNQLNSFYFKLNQTPTTANNDTVTAAVNNNNNNNSSQSIDISVDNAIETTMKYLVNNINSTAAAVTVDNLTTVNTVKDYLQSQLISVRSRIELLRNQLNSINNRIIHLYDSMHSVGYYLLAVLIHEGQSAGQGHYWTYIADYSKSIDSNNKSIQKPKWHCYNDSNVTETTETIVLTEAYGGRVNKNSSAYFLIYCSESELLNSTINNTTVQSIIPESLKSIVLKDNEVFAKEIIDFDTAQLEKLIVTESDKLIQQYTSKKSDIITAMETKSNNNNNSNNSSVLNPELQLKSFNHYLYSLNQLELMEFNLLLEFYQNYKSIEDSTQRESILLATANKLLIAGHQIAAVIKSRSDSNNNNPFSIQSNNSVYNIGSTIQFILDSQKSDAYNQYLIQFNNYVQLIESIIQSIDYIFKCKFPIAVLLLINIIQSTSQSQLQSNSSLNTNIRFLLNLTLYLWYQQCKFQFRTYSHTNTAATTTAANNNNSTTESLSIDLYRELNLLITIAAQLSGPKFHSYLQSNYVLFSETLSTAANENNNTNNSINTVLFNEEQSAEIITALLTESNNNTENNNIDINALINNLKRYLFTESKQPSIPSISTNILTIDYRYNSIQQRLKQELPVTIATVTKFNNTPITAASTATATVTADSTPIDIEIDSEDSSDIVLELVQLQSKAAVKASAAAAPIA